MHNDIELIRECYRIGEQSCCQKKKVGCIITIDNQIISTGYNCIKDKNFDCQSGECSQNIDNKCLMIIHAEQNAIFDAMKKNYDLSKAKLYVNLSPCLPCARLIYGAGIRKIFFSEKYSIFKNQDIDLGEIFLQILNVEIQQIT